VLVRRGGETVDPEAVEAALGRARYVSEVAVVAEAVGGDERPVALVVPDRAVLARKKIVDGPGVVRFAVRECAARLPAAARPVRTVLVRGPLPRTPAGKLLRDAVRSLLEAPPGAAGSVPGAAPPVAALGDDPAGRAVAAALMQVAGTAAAGVSPRDELSLDLGLDSMDRVALVAEVERGLGGALPEGAVLAITVEELLAEARRAVPSAQTDSMAADETARRLLARATRAAGAGAPLRHGVLSASRRWLTRGLRLDLRGVEHLPREGPFVLCPNHLTNLDALLLSAVLPRDVADRAWMLGKRQLFSGAVLRWLFLATRALPTDNRADFTPALRVARLALERGDGLIVFPEGQRALDGRMGVWRAGAGILAASAGAPLVPLALAGVDAVLPPGRAWPRLRDEAGRPRPVRVEILPPIAPPESPPADPGRLAVEGRRLVGEVRGRVEQALAAMPPELRPVQMDLLAAEGAPR
jgi:long-chain acyl-CoA synthetase